jgi:hypothetical protein
MKNFQRGFSSLFILLVALGLVVVGGGVYIFYQQSSQGIIKEDQSVSMVGNPNPVVPTGVSNNGAETGATAESFAWSATKIDQAPSTGGSDFTSEFNLRVSAFGKTYRINDYVDAKISGCRDVTADYRDSILVQYDNSYSSVFFANASSYYLCASVGGGDLFVIEKVGNGYEVKHYKYGDGLSPLTKLTPKVLFTIQK